MPFKHIYLKDDTLLVLNVDPSAIFVPNLADNNSGVRAIVNTGSIYIDKVNGSDFHKNGYFGNESRQLLEKQLHQKKPVAYITEIPKKVRDKLGEKGMSNCIKLMQKNYYNYYLCYDKLPVIHKEKFTICSVFPYLSDFCDTKSDKYKRFNSSGFSIADFRQFVKDLKERKSKIFHTQIMKEVELKFGNRNMPNCLNIDSAAYDVYGLNYRLCFRDLPNIPEKVNTTCSAFPYLFDFCETK